MFICAHLVIVMAGSFQDPPPDTRTTLAQLERYRTSFQDVSFLFEGTMSLAKGGELGTAPDSRFQGHYAYRSDGATVLDVFDYGQEDRPMSRMIYSILGGRMEVLNATPDVKPRVADRHPEVIAGGPGSLDRPDSAERIFFPWLFSSLGDAHEHRVEHQGWDDVQGRRCVKLRMLAYPEVRLKTWKGDLPYLTMWCDPEHDGYPLRIERSSGDKLALRTEITRLKRVELPNRQSIWFPAEGKTWGFMGNRGKDRSSLYTEEPQSVGTYYVLFETLQFNRKPDDAYFSVKKHAAAADDEGLRRLQSQLPTKKARPAILPGDPVSRRNRLDQALQEADRQAARLDASAAAQSEFDLSQVLPAGFGFAGAVGIVLACYLYWRRQ